MGSESQRLTYCKGVPDDLQKCGELIGDHTRVCPACGARQRGSETVINPTHTDFDDCAHENSRNKKKPAASRENLSGLLILIGILMLILCGPALLATLAGNWGSPRMFLLIGAVIVGAILVRIGLTLYKHK